MKSKSGFTLIELSLVIIIIGLIIGGIFAGNTLVRQAELRSVISEIQAFDVATSTYRQKYGAIPGDDPKAFNYFGSACGSDTNAVSSGCNGNGDSKVGRVANFSLFDYFGEGTKYFEHLSRARLIEGSYDGSCNQNFSSSCLYYSGANAPSSKYDNGIWAVTINTWQLGGMATSLTIISRNNTNDNYLNGSYLPDVNGQEVNKAVFRPVDLFNIDQKLDDGKPNIGKVRIHGSGDCINGLANDSNATYKSASNNKCSGYFFINGL